jgi:hypothetical protein
VAKATVLDLGLVLVFLVLTDQIPPLDNNNIIMLVFD